MPCTNFLSFYKAMVHNLRTLEKKQQQGCLDPAQHTFTEEYLQLLTIISKHGETQDKKHVTKGQRKGIHLRRPPVDRIDLTVPLTCVDRLLAGRPPQQLKGSHASLQLQSHPGRTGFVVAGRPLSLSFCTIARRPEVTFWLESPAPRVFNNNSWQEQASKASNSACSDNCWPPSNQAKTTTHLVILLLDCFTTITSYINKKIVHQLNASNRCNRIRRPPTQQFGPSRSLAIGAPSQSSWSAKRRAPAGPI